MSNGLRAIGVVFGLMATPCGAQEATWAKPPPSALAVVPGVTGGFGFGPNAPYGSFQKPPTRTKYPVNPKLARFGPAPYDEGGVVGDYVAGAHASYSEHSPMWGRPSPMYGTCMSACTIMLGAKDVCVRHDARFWFHGASMLPPEIRHVDVPVYNRKASLELMDYYPPVIRDWIKASGAFNQLRFSEKHMLTGEQLIRMGFRECSQAEIDEFEAR